MATTMHEFRSKLNKGRMKDMNQRSFTRLENDSPSHNRTLAQMKHHTASVGTDMELESTESFKAKVALRNMSQSQAYNKELDLSKLFDKRHQKVEKNLSLPEVHNTDRPTTFGMRHGSTGDIQPDSISHFTIKSEQ
jgi:ferric-dicitrate binding protein FerR (iron transport regulator)